MHLKKRLIILVLMHKYNKMYNNSKVNILLYLSGIG